MAACARAQVITATRMEPIILSDGATYLGQTGKKTGKPTIAIKGLKSKGLLDPRRGLLILLLSYCGVLCDELWEKNWKTWRSDQ